MDANKQPLLVLRTLGLQLSLVSIDNPTSSCYGQSFSPQQEGLG